MISLYSMLDNKCQNSKQNIMNYTKEIWVLAKYY